MVIMIGSRLFAFPRWLLSKLGTSRQVSFMGDIVGVLLFEWHGYAKYLTGLVWSLILIGFLARWTENSQASIGLFLVGLAISILFLFQSALLPAVISCMVFELCYSRNRRKWVPLGLMTLGTLLAIAPWT